MGDWSLANAEWAVGDAEKPVFDAKGSLFGIKAVGMLTRPFQPAGTL